MGCSESPQILIQRSASHRTFAGNRKPRGASLWGKFLQSCEPDEPPASSSVLSPEPPGRGTPRIFCFVDAPAEVRVSQVVWIPSHFWTLCDLQPFVGHNPREGDTCAACVCLGTSAGGGGGGRLRGAQEGGTSTTYSEGALIHMLRSIELALISVRESGAAASGATA